MKRKSIVFLGLLLLVLPGCDALKKDPKAELLAATKIFTATVDILTELKAQGQLGVDEINDVSAAIHLGQKYLHAWKAAVEVGKTDPEVVSAFNLLMSELMKVRTKHGR